MGDACVRTRSPPLVTDPSAWTASSLPNPDGLPRGHARTAPPWADGGPWRPVRRPLKRACSLRLLTRPGTTGAQAPHADCGGAATHHSDPRRTAETGFGRPGANPAQALHRFIFTEGPVLAVARVPRGPGRPPPLRKAMTQPPVDCHPPLIRCASRPAMGQSGRARNLFHLALTLAI